MKVWVVYREFQAGTPDIIGVFTSEELAIRARCAAVDHDIKHGAVVEGENDDDGDTDWTVDINIVETQLANELPEEA